MAAVSVIAFIPYLALQIKGAGYVFNVVTEGRMPVWAGAAIAYGVVLVYVFKSGVMGVAWTNTFQGICMMVLAWGLGLYLPWKLRGGVGPMFESTTKEKGLLAGPEYLHEYLAADPPFPPCLAISGITSENTPALRSAAGIAHFGVAVSGALCAARDPEAAARDILIALQRRQPNESTGAVETRCP